MNVSILLGVTILIVGLLVLWVATSYTIRGVVRISKSTGMSETSLGFLLIAFTTSVPELAITIVSSGTGAVGLAVGNLLGSNIANIGLVVGLPFLMLAILNQGKKVNDRGIRDAEMKNLYLGLFVASMIPVVLVLWVFSIKVLGAILVVSYFVVSYRLIRVRESGDSSDADSDLPKSKVIRDSVMIGLGLVGVIGSSYYIVDSAVGLANLFNVSELFIGSVIIAIGTSLPELSITLSAVLRKHRGLAIGNAIGSGFTNLTLIFGILLLISPTEIMAGRFIMPIIFTILLNIFLWIFLASKKLNAIGSGFLVLLYALFLVSNFTLGF